jgi:succinyl-diaminopimelate desuccinylase
METLSGKRPMAAGAAYFTYCSVLTPAFGNPPTIILGPGEPEMAHKTDEFCYLSKIELAVEAYTEISRQWCGI